MAAIALSSARRPLMAVRPSLGHMHIPRPTSTPVSRRPVSTLVEYAVAGPTAIIDAIHGVGVPFYAALPLTALFVRGFVVYHLSALPARRRAEKTVILSPLIEAKVKMVVFNEGIKDGRRDIANHGRPAPEVVVTNRRRWRRFWGAIRISRQLNNAFESSWGVRRWQRYAGILNFGILIAFTEAIRLKCGRAEGLLSLLLKPIEMLSNDTTNDPEVAEKVDSAELLANRIGEKLEAVKESYLSHRQGGEVEGFSELDITPEAVLSAYPELLHEPTVKYDTSSPYFDSALQHEGLSWCTDLTLADPTYALPAVTALVLIGSTVLRPSRTSVSKSTTLTKGFSMPSRIDRLTIAGYLVFGALATQLPAAILLYVIPNFLTGWAQGRYLDIRHPIKDPIRSCVRPLRYKTKQAWSD